MQTFLFYTQQDQRAYVASDIVEGLESFDGFVWQGEWQNRYRNGTWTDPATGAMCHIDVGELEFDSDEVKAEKTYEGWTRNPLSVQIPLSVPHWHCVECLRFIEEYCQTLPGLFVLDTEDVGDEERDPGPRTIHRLESLAEWEQLHTAQTAEREDCYRMSRVSSVAMWRYRRATYELDEEWPMALVLLDKDIARSAVVWDEPEDYLIVPPVELAVLKTETHTIVMSVEELISRAEHVNNLDCAGAVKIPIDDDFEDIIGNCVKMDVSRFKFLADGEWSD